MKAYIQLVIIELKLYFRDFQSVFWSFIFPPLMLFLFGLMYTNKQQKVFNNLGFIDLFIPGLIAIGILATALFSISVLIIDYRERGILRRFRGTPLKPWILIMAHMSTAYCTSSLNIIFLMILGIGFYKIHFNGSLFIMFLAVSFSTISIFALGFIIASVVNSTKAANTIAMTIFMPMMILSGAIMPLRFFSKSIQTIGKFMPLTYVVNLLRSVWQGEGLNENIFSIFILSLCAILGVWISTIFFKWE